MLRFFLHHLWLRALTYGLGAVVLYQGYLLLGGGDTDLGFQRQSLGNSISTRIALELPKPDRVRTLAVLPLMGDSNQVLTQALRQGVRNSGKYDVIDESFFARILREVGRQERPIEQLDDALVLARRLGVDYVLFGEVADFETTEARTSLKLNLRLADRQEGQAVFVRSFEEVSEGGWFSPDYWRARTVDSPKPRRVFIWVMFTLLLPLVLAKAIRRVTSEESNTWNFGVLAGLTGIDMLVAGALTGFWVPSWITAVTLLAALVCAALYNYVVVTRIDEFRR